MQSILARLPWLVAIIRVVRDWFRIELRVMLKREVPMRLRERYCTNTLVRAAKRHRSRTWSGDVLYLRAGTFEGKTMALEGWWDDTTLGYEELCEGHFDLHVVGGYHNEPFSFTYSADRVRAAFRISPPGD